MNNKGFTLIELLAVLVILTAIMTIAIPSISSSMERTKSKQEKSKIKVLEAAAEMYVTDHKNAIYSGDNESYNIYVRDLKDNGYITDGIDDISEDDCIEFIKATNKYNYKKKCSDSQEEE